jgi:lysophospholipase L1-like esterase
MKKVYFCWLLYCIILLSGCKKNHLNLNSNGSLEVINSGIPGNTANDLLARIKDVTDLRPDIVIIMIGTNDASTSSKIYNAFRSNLNKIIDRIRENSAKVILLTPPPCLPSSKFYPNSGKLDMICSIISAVSRDKSCEMVDIHGYINSILKQTDSVGIYNRDGLHPNKTGYSDISNCLLTYFQQHPINNGFKIVCFGDSITYGYEVDGQGTSTGDTYPADLRRGINYSLISDHKFSEADY